YVFCSKPQQSSAWHQAGVHRASCQKTTTHSQEVQEMYSLVFVMVMTTGAETAAFGRRHSCHGCNGGGYVSCGGGGCHGSSDCCGGRRGHRRHRCHGCNGGCN